MRVRLAKRIAIWYLDANRFVLHGGCGDRVCELSRYGRVIYPHAPVVGGGLGGGISPGSLGGALDRRPQPRGQSAMGGGAREGDFSQTLDAESRVCEKSVVEGDGRPMVG